MSCEVKEIFDGIMANDCLTYSVLANGEIEITKRLNSNVVYMMREDIKWKLEIPAAIEGYKVAGIGEEAFKKTLPAKIVNIAPGIRYIGKNAFTDSRMMEIVRIPRSVEEIGTDAFDIHREFKAYLHRCWKDEFVWDEEMGEIDDVYIYQGRALSDEDMQPLEPIYPDGYEITFEVENESYAQKYAAENGFGYRCDNYIDGDFAYRLRTWQGETVADVVKYYGHEAMLRIPDKLGGYAVKGIGKEAFFRNMKLRHVTIPAGVTRIGKSAFKTCLNLKCVTLPESLMQIDGWAFQGCEKLSSIELPDGLKEVNFYAFEGCSRLKTVKIPGTLRCIREDVFAECTSLREVNMEEGVKGVLADAFRGCCNLRKVQIPESMMFMSRDAYGSDGTENEEK